MIIDPKILTAELIKCRSITPEDAGAIRTVEMLLRKYGFSCHRINKNGIANLFARWGNQDGGPTFLFCGHTDVVAPGDNKSWTFDPFLPTEQNGFLYGRGACDMKSAIAAFVSSAIELTQKSLISGSIAIAITGDEEGRAEFGTQEILKWMKKNRQKASHCLVGEPTCPSALGEMIKVGRRGSLNIKIHIHFSE